MLLSFGKVGAVLMEHKGKKKIEQQKGNAFSIPNGVKKKEKEKKNGGGGTRKAFGGYQRISMGGHP